MLLSPVKQNLEDRIVNALHKKSQDGPALLAELKKENPYITKETFYRILRKLLKEEIATKQGILYEINRHWLQRIYRWSYKYIEKNDTILSLKEGDKITYKFKNANLMGIYWAHTYDAIFEKHNPLSPILVYHPHEWLIYIRAESETFFLNRFVESKKLVLFGIGGTTMLDKKFIKKWNTAYRQINIGEKFGIKNTDYINVVGDFIFKVSINKKTADDIDTFFAHNAEVTPENQYELEKICNRNDRATMVLIRSKKEADKWRAKFKKHFYIPKEYREYM